MTKRYSLRTILDEELIRDFCQIVADGNFRMTACARLGIPYSTYKSWMSSAKRDERQGKTGDESLFIHFKIAVAQVEAVVEMQCVQDILHGSNEDKKWYLTRRHNKKYNGNSNIVLDDEQGTEEKIDPVLVLAAKLAELKERLGGGSE